MFKLNPNPEFTIPVPLTVPGETGQSLLDVTFRHKGKTDLAAWLKTSTDGKSDLAALTEVVSSWDGVTDDSGAAVTFSADALATLLDQYPAAAGEFFSAYLKGLTESRAKN